MLKRDQIVPYLDAYMRTFRDGSTNLARLFVRTSTCHRVIANGLLLHHYKGYDLISVKTVVRRSPFSEETTRRALRDGIDMGIIDKVEDKTDRRRKRIRASQLLVDCFESTHVESTDARTKTKGDR